MGPIAISIIYNFNLFPSKFARWYPLSSTLTPTLTFGINIIPIVLWHARKLCLPLFTKAVRVSRTCKFRSSNSYYILKNVNIAIRDAAEQKCGLQGMVEVSFRGELSWMGRNMRKSMGNGTPWPTSIRAELTWESKDGLRTHWLVWVS